MAPQRSTNALSVFEKEAAPILFNEDGGFSYATYSYVLKEVI